MMVELNNPRESFEKFSELNVGLGIKICHQLAKILSPPEEKLEIVSKKGQGTTCTFVIDITEPPVNREGRAYKKSVYTDQKRQDLIKFTEIHNLNKAKAERSLDEEKEDIEI